MNVMTNTTMSVPVSFSIKPVKIESKMTQSIHIPNFYSSASKKHEYNIQKSKKNNKIRNNK